MSCFSLGHKSSGVEVGKRTPKREQKEGGVKFKIKTRNEGVKDYVSELRPSW